jgi:hypothetical protein
MKQSKWFKWQVGMIASVTAVFLFHEVKASPAFEQATAAANNGTTDTNVSGAVGTQDYMDRWASQTITGTTDNTGNTGTSNQSDTSTRSSVSGSTGSSSSSSSNSVSHSRTGRS